MKKPNEPLAQQVEHRPFKPGVLGSSPRRLRFIQHTADLGFIVWGDTPEEVVSQAIYALFLAILGEKYPNAFLQAGPEERFTRRVKISGPDLSLSLHDLLEELLYLFEEELIVPIGVKQLTVRDDSITAELEFVRLEQEKLEDVREVKAITYHRLRFERREEAWEAEVVLDL